MSEEIKKFFTTYTDFVTKVTSDPSIDLEALKKSFNEAIEDPSSDLPNCLLSILMPSSSNKAPESVRPTTSLDTLKENIL